MRRRFMFADHCGWNRRHTFKDGGFRFCDEVRLCLQVLSCCSLLAPQLRKTARTSVCKAQAFSRRILTATESRGLLQTPVDFRWDTVITSTVGSLRSGIMASAEIHKNILVVSENPECKPTCTPARAIWCGTCNC